MKEVKNPCDTSEIFLNSLKYIGEKESRLLQKLLFFCFRAKIISFSNQPSPSDVATPEQ